MEKNLFNNRFSVVTLASAIVMACCATASLAQDSDVIDLGNLTCRDYLMMAGEERDNTTVFLHGYFSGTLGQTQVHLSALSDASDAVIKACIDGPDASLLNVFEASRK